MNPVRWLVGKMRDALALDVGLQELGSGLRYPVKPYAERVSDDLVRGSRPDGREPGLAEFWRLAGAVSLCAEPCVDAWPARVATLRIPVVDNTAPRPEQVAQFLAFVRAHGPVYVHCEAGKGRTGVFVACYRIAVQGWTRERAIQDAIQHGLQLDCQIDFLRRWAP